MPTYRFYWLNKDNHIVRADTVIAAADDEARLLAEARLGSTPEIEIWCGPRWVARVGARTLHP
jgi:hypothetical protein